MITLTATIDGTPWTAYISPYGDVEIYRGSELFDRGHDDGEIIHDAYRTPEAVLKALESGEVQ